MNARSLCRNLLAPFDEETAKTAQQQWAKRLNSEVVETNSIGMKLTLIPPGEFTMGSPETESGRDVREKQHCVKIAAPFSLGVYHVTYGDFLTFYHAAEYKTEAETDGKGGWGFHSNGDFGQKPEYTFRSWGRKQTDDRPVVNVSWNDAQAYCKWLRKKEGKTYRLPTEAEWEYACRAGTTTPFSFGPSLNGRQANYNGNHPYGTEEKGPYVDNTTPVGKYPANAFGLYDMHGNAFQWCQDWCGDDYYSNSATDDPQGPTHGEFRVIRGGCWYSSAVHCRSADRFSNGPANRNCYLGFRVVQVPPGK
jgi:formylglycine-generating enzyme required for sulfatase activity